MPTEPKSLEELLVILGAAAPKLDDFAESILRANPNLIINEPEGRQGYLLGRFLAIGIMNFLCQAYGLPPNTGYIPTHPQN